MLHRIVRLAAGEIMLDLSGKRNGRGAYICKQVACWQTAVAKPHLVGQALKTAVTTDMITAVAAARPPSNQLSD